MSNEETPKIEGSTFAIVALMGRVEYAGKVTEVELYGAKLLRIDVPAITKNGNVRPGFTLYVNFQNSGYSLVPCDEDAAKAHTWYHAPDAIEPWVIKNYLQTFLPDPGGSRPSEQIVRDNDWSDDPRDDDLNRPYGVHASDWDDDDWGDDDPESGELVPA